MNYDRVTIKQNARQLLRTATPKPWVVALVYYLLTVVLGNAVTGLVPSPTSGIVTAIVQNPDGFLADPSRYLSIGIGNMGKLMSIAIFVTVLVSLYQTVMSYGYAGYNLRLWDGARPGYGDLFSGFALAGKAIGSSIMVSIFTLLWSLIPIVLYTVLLVGGVMVMDSSLAMGIVMILCAVVVLVVGTLWITFRYILTPYFLMDDPDMGVFEAITASKTAMRGNIGKRVMLGLSFLGWELLVLLIGGAILSIGLGAIFAGNSAAIQHGMEPAMLIATAGLPAVLVVALAVLVPLPLNLWLTAYQSAAFAGFYAAVTQRGASMTDGAPVIPPAPPVPVPFEPAEPAGGSVETPEEEPSEGSVDAPALTGDEDTHEEV